MHATAMIASVYCIWYDIGAVRECEEAPCNSGWNVVFSFSSSSA